MIPMFMMNTITGEQIKYTAVTMCHSKSNISTYTPRHTAG
jgi:hypothetical protein